MATNRGFITEKGIFTHSLGSENPDNSRIGPVWTAVAGQQIQAISRARKKAQAPGGIGGVIVPELGAKNVGFLTRHLFERICAGHLLAQVGDPRVSSLPEFVEIQAGEAVVGTSSDEVPGILDDVRIYGVKESWLHDPGTNCRVQRRTRGGDRGLGTSGFGNAGKGRDPRHTDRRVEDDPALRRKHPSF